MEITVILKQKLESLPPTINLIDCLIDLDVKVNLLCTDIEQANIIRYDGKIHIEVIPSKDYKFRPLKVFSVISFRRNVYKFLNKNSISKAADSFVWLASAEASLGVGRRIANYKFIFQSHELYDTRPQYKFQNKFYYRNSIVNVCPEINRAAIVRYWYKLKETPQLLVNSPYHHPKKRNLFIESKSTAKAVSSLSDKKIILYMGQVSPERDITPFAEAIDLLGGEYHLLVMGAYIPERNYIEGLKSRFKNITFMDGLPSPSHLQVTSWAHIGILSYSFIDLNNVFCAPNKVWEYSGFGIPMISNDIPGIQTLLLKYNSGNTINIETSSAVAIAESIKKIDHDYIKLSDNARNMFDDCNFKRQLEDILNKLN